MQQFAAHYPDFKIMPQTVAQLPWGHISVLIHKIKDDNARIWYADMAIDHGWSRLTLERYIKDDLFLRQAVPSRLLKPLIT
jgi:predicted nuclease of restriction endonuclease-like (RecB) superfamily